MRNITNTFIGIVLLIAIAAKLLSLYEQATGIGIEGNIATANLIPTFGIVGMHAIAMLITVGYLGALKLVDFASKKLLPERNQLVVGITVFAVLAALLIMEIADLAINISVLILST